MSIPSNWVEVRRPADGERVGYLQRAGRTLWRPLGLDGVPLGDVACDRDATAVVLASAHAARESTE